MHNELQLDQLGNYNLLEIFDWMDFDELLKMVEMNQRFYQLIIRHYAITKYQINNKTLLIMDHSRSNKTIEITVDHIKVNQYETALQFLRYFGHIISNVEFNAYLFRFEQSNKITSQVNKYCSKSLTQMTIRNLRSDQIAEWKNQFKNLKTVRLLGSTDCENIQMNFLFPVMQQLEFESVTFSNSSFIEENFPHLMHLKYFKTFSHENNTHMERALVLNPQLRSFSIGGLVDAEFLEFTARQLPNLEILGLLSFPHGFHNNDVGKTVRFKNVRELTVDLYRNRHEVPEHIPLVFDRLEKIEMLCHYVPEQAAQFISQNKKLKEVHVPWTDLSREHLLSFVEDLPNLVEISARWKPDAAGSELIALISRKDIKLSKITVFLYGDIDSLRSALFATIPSELELVDDRGIQLTLMYPKKYSQEILIL